MRTLRFLKTLGNGAFGTVYLAELTSGQNFRRNIAIKILHNTDENNNVFVSRVRDEARLLGLLQDDEILQVLGLEKIAGQDAILMEYVDGIDLAEIIKKNTAISHRSLATIGAICSGILYRAHSAIDPRTQKHLNVIHRDIKPANIMLTKNGGIKICDFGVARARFEGQEAITLDPDMLFGTLSYMAPEYIRTGLIAPSADIYALAISILEIASKRKFGKPKLRRREYEAHVQHHIQLSKLPKPLTDILQKMLQWKQEDRPSGKECQYLFYAAADMLQGMDLRRWAEQTLPPLIAHKQDAEDNLGLLGQTIALQAPDMSSNPKRDISHQALQKNNIKPEINIAPNRHFTPQKGWIFGSIFGVFLFLSTLFLHF